MADDPPENMCPRCGYLQVTAARPLLCAECGFTGEQSASARLLRYADPAWVNKLIVGCRLIRIGCHCMLGALVGPLAIAMIRGALRSSKGYHALLSVLEGLAWLCFAAALLAPLLLLIGLAALFAHDPYESHGSRTTARRAINYLAVPVLGLWILYSQGALGRGSLQLWVNSCGVAIVIAHTLALIGFTDDLRLRCAARPINSGRGRVPPYAACMMYGVVIVFALMQRDPAALRFSWILWFGAVYFTRWSLEPALHTELAYRPAASPTQPKS